MTHFDDTEDYWVEHPDEVAFEVESAAWHSFKTRTVDGRATPECRICGEMYDHRNHFQVELTEREQRKLARPVAPGYNTRAVERILDESVALLSDEELAARRPNREHTKDWDRDD